MSTLLPHGSSVKLDSRVLLYTLDFCCVINIFLSEGYHNSVAIPSLEGSTLSVTVWEQSRAGDSISKSCLSRFVFVITKDTLASASFRGSYNEPFLSIPLKHSFLINSCLVIADVSVSMESILTEGFTFKCVEHKCSANFTNI